MRVYKHEFIGFVRMVHPICMAGPTDRLAPKYGTTDNGNRGNFSTSRINCQERLIEPLVQIVTVPVRKTGFHKTHSDSYGANRLWSRQRGLPRTVTISVSWNFFSQFDIFLTFEPPRSHLVSKQHGTLCIFTFILKRIQISSSLF